MDASPFTEVSYATVTYMKGKNIVLANTLSRAHMPMAAGRNDDNAEILYTQSAFEIYAMP